MNAPHKDRPRDASNRLYSLLTIAGVLTPSLASAQQNAERVYPTLGEIEFIDKSFCDLIHPNARLEILAEGFEWTEGPVWVPQYQGYLLFSDIPRNTVNLWSERTGLQTFLRPSGYTGEALFEGSEPGSNGLVLDPEGHLILCQHGDRRVARLKPDGAYETLASRYDDKRLNSPNDAVLHSENWLYFTDPPYGLPARMEDPEKELDFQGVYRLSLEDHELELLTDKISRPNGIGLSPDERTLYVANSDPEKPVWYAFRLKDDGTINWERGEDLERYIFADASDRYGKEPGLPDGLVVDQHGNVFATGPGGVWVFAPNGTHLGTIKTGERTANCTFGGPYGRTLFITADMYLCRIETLTRGIGRSNTE